MTRNAIESDFRSSKMAQIGRPKWPSAAILKNNPRIMVNSYIILTFIYNIDAFGKVFNLPLFPISFLKNITFNSWTWGGPLVHYFNNSKY